MPSCIVCAVTIPERPRLGHGRCRPCYYRFCNAKGFAHGTVCRAVRRGDLPAQATQKCVDCGAQARDYDHRDYRNPLDVVPVCRGCNLKRGPGIWPEVIGDDGKPSVSLQATQAQG